MNRSVFGSRLIPRIADAVREGRKTDDDSAIDAAVDQAITHYPGNPLLSEKRHGRSDFADHADDLIAHRTTKPGFYLSHAHDEAHNSRVEHADALFPYDTPHTRKNGVIRGLARKEVFLTSGISGVFGATIGGVGYMFASAYESGGVSPEMWAAGLTLSSVLIPLWSKAPVHAVNKRYREIGEQADQVWDTYVEQRDYNADVKKPSMPFEYWNMRTYREPRMPSLTSSKP